MIYHAFSIHVYTSKVGTLKDQTNLKPAFDIFIEDKADFVILNDYTAKFKKGIPVEPDIN